MTVILPCYILTEELLTLTTAAIESFGDVELIIIDNGSPIGGGYLRTVADIYVRNQENLGYAKAVNQGLQLTSDTFIAIANNDIRVSPNWQSVAHEVLLEQDVYSCHFRMLDYDQPLEYGNTTWSTGKERWCTSSFFVIRSNDPQLYDDILLNSYDDWEYWYRIRSFGFKTAYTTKACYQHKHSTTQQLIPSREIQNIQNREYFKEKHGEYPEDLFERMYPDQFKQDYWQGFI